MGEGVGSFTMAAGMRHIGGGAIFQRRLFASQARKALGPFRALILGPPGGGKGTLSARLCADFDLVHLSSGDVLRSQIDAKTDVGVKAKSFMNEGKLVPDSVMTDLIINELGNRNAKSWLLDGFPRTKAQAEALNEKNDINFVLHLDIPSSEIVERIQHRWVHVGSGRVYHALYKPPKIAGVDDETGEKLIQRPDDTEEAVRKRLDIYEEETAPIVDHYRSKGVLKTFKGTSSDILYPMMHQAVVNFAE